MFVFCKTQRKEFNLNSSFRFVHQLVHFLSAQTVLSSKLIITRKSCDHGFCHHWVAANLTWRSDLHPLTHQLPVTPLSLMSLFPIPPAAHQSHSQTHRRLINDSVHGGKWTRGGGERISQWTSLSYISWYNPLNISALNHQLCQCDQSHLWLLN